MKGSETREDIIVEDEVLDDASWSPALKKKKKKKEEEEESGGGCRFIDVDTFSKITSLPFFFLQNQQ